LHPKIGDEVAFVEDNRYDQSIDRTVLQDKARNTFDKTVADIETKINRTKATSVNTNPMDIDEDDIFPGAAKDMGSGKIIYDTNYSIYHVFLFISEAKIRFLKARLRVMQEELERMHNECAKRVNIHFKITFQQNFFL